MNTNIFWYKQAMCFVTWRRDENNFGDKMACQLMLNQLLTIDGVCVDSRITKTEAVLERFTSYCKDNELIDEVERMFKEKEYKLLLWRLESEIEGRIGKHSLQYASSDIVGWCKDFCDLWLSSSNYLCDTERERFAIMNYTVIPLMCKYLSENDLEFLDTYDSLLLKLNDELFDDAGSYTVTFRTWCRIRNVKDMCAERERLLRLFDIQTDMALDRLLQLNMLQEDEI